MAANEFDPETVKSRSSEDTDDAAGTTTGTATND